MNIEQMQTRIAKKIRANDIHHKGRLTTEQIANIDAVTVYSWIHTGEWKAKHFKMWLDAIHTCEKASNAVNWKFVVCNNCDQYQIVDKMSSSNNLSKHNQFWCNVGRALADGDGGLFFSLALLGVVCLATISAVLAVSFIHLGVIPTVGIVFILALIKVMHVGLSNK